MSNAQAREKDRSQLASKLDLEAKKLLDLTLRNKMIKYRPTARAHIDGHTDSIGDLIAALTDEEYPKPIHLVARPGTPGSTASWTSSGGKATFTYVAAEDEDPVRRPRNLARESTVFEQEHGYGALFLATGFVEWTEAPGTEPILAPLILYPVVLQRVGHGEKYAVHATGDEPTLNPAIGLKLKEQSLDFPELDDFSADGVKKYVDNLDRILAKKNWRVKPKVCLGMFKFHKFVMYKDIQKLSEYIGGGGSITGAIKALLEPDHEAPDMDGQPVLEEREIDERIDWRRANYVLDADPSQIVAMEQVKAGKNLVLQGPPGTGKSQTIANLIAELLGEGKRVLFVSEKEAALDVVKRRLDQAGLGTSA